MRQSAPSTDDLLNAVARSQRRAVLRELAARDANVLPVELLVSAVSDRCTEDSSQEPPDRDQLWLQLRHTHLPLLDDVGLVSYDPDLRTVRYTGSRRVESLLALLRQSQNG